MSLLLTHPVPCVHDKIYPEQINTHYTIYQFMGVWKIWLEEEEAHCRPPPLQVIKISKICFTPPPWIRSRLLFVLVTYRVWKYTYLMAFLKKIISRSYKNWSYSKYWPYLKVWRVLQSWLLHASYLTRSPTQYNPTITFEVYIIIYK